MPHADDKLDFEDLKLINFETGWKARDLQELMKFKPYPSLMDKIRYFEYVISQIDSEEILQEYIFPDEINYEELALKQIVNENNDLRFSFGIPFSNFKIELTKETLLAS